MGRLWKGEWGQGVADKAAEKGASAYAAAIGAGKKRGQGSRGWKGLCSRVDGNQGADGRREATAAPGEHQIGQPRPTGASWRSSAQLLQIVL
jgi:hypothetical protein